MKQETFSDIIKNYDRKDIEKQIYSKTEADVIAALNKERRDLSDFMALISPAAEKYLEQMANVSHKLTRKRFGNTVQLYLPLYLSNYCENQCVYCGFNAANKINRKVLDKSEIEAEIDAIKHFGFEHILLVTGESNYHAGVDYLADAIRQVKEEFSQVTIEVQPLDTDGYIKLKEAGLHGCYIYQETYNQETYNNYHLKGKKADYSYRLETPDRLGQAGVYKIGLGCLLGLEDWRIDSFYTALHLKYLEKKYWKSKYCLSFPRLRPHVGSFQPNYPISDAQLVQLICAYRMLDGEVELSISVRESAKFRDNIYKLGITSMSAGSKTEPGGYAINSHALEQFEVHDGRTPQEIESMLKQNNYEAVWKDWDPYMG